MQVKIKFLEDFKDGNVLPNAVSRNTEMAVDEMTLRRIEQSHPGSVDVLGKTPPPPTGPTSEQPAPEPEEVPEPEAEVDEVLTRSEVINLVGEVRGQALIDAGFSSISSLEGLSFEDLTEIEGVGPATATKVLEALGDDG